MGLREIISRWLVPDKPGRAISDAARQYSRQAFPQDIVRAVTVAALRPDECVVHIAYKLTTTSPPSAPYRFFRVTLAEPSAVQSHTIRGRGKSAKTAENAYWASFDKKYWARLAQFGSSIKAHSYLSVKLLGRIPRCQRDRLTLPSNRSSSHSICERERIVC